MSEFCPHCGYNLARDEAIVLGAWRLEPGGVWYKGEFQDQITSAEAAMLHTLAKAGGRPVTSATIAARISSATENPTNIISVHAHRLRSKLSVVPFETAHGRGYRWAA